MYRILDPTYKWSHTVSFSFWPTALSVLASSCVHVAAVGIIASLLWLSGIPFYIGTAFGGRITAL